VAPLLLEGIYQLTGGVTLPGYAPGGCLRGWLRQLGYPLVGSASSRLLPGAKGGLFISLGHFIYRYVHTGCARSFSDMLCIALAEESACKFITADETLLRKFGASFACLRWLGDL